MIEMTLEEADKAIEAKDALIRMMSTADYKLVFDTAYFTDEAARMPLYLVDDEMQDEIEQRIALEKAKSIGHTKVFLNTLISKGNYVEQQKKLNSEAALNKEAEQEFDEVSGEPIVNGEV